MSEKTSLAQALAKLDEAMRPSHGGSADPARRRVAQRLAQLARCEDEDLPAFAKRHMPGRTVEESGLRAARDLLLAIGGIAEMEEGGPDAWAALDEMKRILDLRLAEAKAAAALKRKAEAEEAAADPPPSVAPMWPQGPAAPLAAPPPVPSQPFAVAPAPAPAAAAPFAVAPAPAAPVPFAVAPAAAPSLPFAVAPASAAAVPFAVAPAAVPFAVAPAPAAAVPFAVAPAPVPFAVAPAPAAPAAVEPLPFTPAAAAVPTPSLAGGTRSPTHELPAFGALPSSSAASALPFAARAGWDRPAPPSSAPRYDSVLPFRPPTSPAAQASAVPPPTAPAAPVGPIAAPLPGPASNPPLAPAAPAAAPREERASTGPELASWRAPPQSARAAPSSGPSAAASSSPLTLEQYAGMVVACELYPLHAQNTQSRYGVRTPDERAALDRFWQSRLSADPVLAEQWERMRENARRYFRQGPS
ncbi:hypothetical protein [Sorangium sp. So ce1000]|uniref:hypothetical protein n=1 Tax=Sorangium sp. So ce1000 TaxID=3133325 RepID=UPI003F60A5E3